jgi:hypothetical protein
MKPFEHALSGFNHNVKHKGQLYHVQTEDSGRHNPTVTTLLFLGGNILASLKASYAEHLDSEELPKRVRELMEAQHKQMLRNLMKGHYDKGNNEARSKHWKVGQLEGETTGEPRAITTEEQPALVVPSATDELAEAAPFSPADASPTRRPGRPLSILLKEPTPMYLLTAGKTQTPGENATTSRRPSRPLPLMPEEVVLPGVQAAASSFENEEMGAVFGGGVVSERRLDELILNYLFREKDKLG